MFWEKVFQNEKIFLSKLIRLLFFLTWVERLDLFSFVENYSEMRMTIFFFDKLIFSRQLKDCVVSVVEQLKVELVHRPRQSDQPRGGQVRQKLEDELIWISRRRTRFIPLNLEELSLLIFNHFVNPTLSVILCGWCKSTWHSQENKAFRH